jgi:hypothetical protein
MAQKIMFKIGKKMSFADLNETNVTSVEYIYISV